MRSLGGLIASVVAVLATVGGCGYTGGAGRLLDKPFPPEKLTATKFLDASKCKDCHPVHYREWKTSMHAYAQHSPFFVAFQTFIQGKTGGTLGTFCVRCHTPIGMSIGESPVRPNSERPFLSMQSVSCTVCHAVATRDGQASSSFHVPIPGDQEPTIYGPYYGYDEPGAPNDPELRLLKAPHKSRYSPYFTQARFCGQCHDVFFTDGTRLEEAFIEWKNSPYARRGVICQDCHMGPVPGKITKRQDLPKEPIVDEDLFPDAPKRHRTSHLFMGPDYSVLPAFGKEELLLDDAGFKAHEAGLEEIRKTLFRNAATMKVSHDDQIAPGSTLKVTVAVTNSGAGHNLPTGFAAERQTWLEVIVKDPTGKVLYVSGDLDKNGDLRDYESEEVREGTVPRDHDLTNFEAKFIVTGFRGSDTDNISTTNRLLDPVPFLNPASTASAIMGHPFSARQFKRGIPPLKTKTATYGIKIPEGTQGPLTLSVRFRYRNLPPHLLADIGTGDLRPKLRIVDMAEYEKQIGLAR